MRRIVLLLCFLPCLLFSQYRKTKPDSSWFEKKNYVYMGIQSNLLLQQFISFNSNSSINSNPYLFSYAINHSQKGYGFALGTGISVNESSTNDGVASVKVQNTNVSLRVGFERKYLQQQRFIPFVGVEFGMGGLYNKTTSILNQSFNNSSTSIETTKLFIGPSLRSGLHYALSMHILIGTEFFLNAQIAWSNTQVTNSSSTGLQPTVNNSSSVIPFNVGFQAPTALFLVFRY
jgi:hypothetical protein